MAKVAQQWTEHEFSGLELGNARLDRRAKELIKRLAEKPGAREALIYSGGWNWPVKKASGKAQIRSNSWLLREFATPQGVFFHGQVRPHELISASLVS